MTNGDNVVVFGFGNPLLDIQLHTDASFLSRFKLAKGGFTFEGKEQAGIYEELRAHPKVVYVPGGATLNSLRVFQALAGQKSKAFYLGCVGLDEDASIMRDLCVKEGLSVSFPTTAEALTGVCGVCVVDKERSLCTRRGASAFVRVEHLMASWHSVEKAAICYSAGFVIDACPAGMTLLGQHCTATKKLFATNLSAPFMVSSYKEDFKSLMPYVDILFGNASEFSVLGEILGCPSDLPLDEVAWRIALLPKEGSRPRSVVVTQGHLHTIVVCGWNGLLKKVFYPVVPLEREEIIDTNAAGDAFVGGFFHGLALQMRRLGVALPPPDLDFDLAVHWGHVAARHVVQHDGCSFNFEKLERDVLGDVLEDVRGEVNGNCGM